MIHFKENGFCHPTFVDRPAPLGHPNRLDLMGPAKERAGSVFTSLARTGGTPAGAIVIPTSTPGFDSDAPGGFTRVTGGGAAGHFKQTNAFDFHHRRSRIDDVGEGSFPHAVYRGGGSG